MRRKGLSSAAKARPRGPSERAQASHSPTSSRQGVEPPVTFECARGLRIGHPRYGRLEVCATSRGGSADWESAVSPTGSRQGGAECGRFADCQFATQQAASLRYGSAGFQPAVSPTSSRQGVEPPVTFEFAGGLRIGNPHYSRLEVCATSRGQGCEVKFGFHRPIRVEGFRLQVPGCRFLAKGMLYLKVIRRVPNSAQQPLAMVASMAVPEGRLPTQKAAFRA